MLTKANTSRHYSSPATFLPLPPPTSSTPPPSISGEMKLLKDDASPPVRRLSLDAALFSRDRYKLLALAALLLLAVWSMFTGTLTLKSSESDPAAQISAFSASNLDDLDVLEVADREKLVKKLWNVYNHGYRGPESKIRLPRFWEEAFQAAYQSLVSDTAAVRDGAIFEIAKMSLVSLDLLSSPTQSTMKGETGKKSGSNSRKLRSL